MLKLKILIEEIKVKDDMLLRNWKKHSKNITIWQYRQWHSKVPEKNKLKKILPTISAETFISHKQWLGCWLGSTLQKELT